MKLPRATYRIQFNNTFTFKDTRSILGYLTALGITHLYASPIFKACKGSMHGYDVVDPREINPEIGDRTDFEELRIDAKQQGIGWIQDIVPNHMAFNSDNALLMELLENGPEFAEHQYFDINWEHPYEGIRGKLLAPFLGDMYGECLERGEIKLTYDKNGFSLNYYEHRFPLFIETYTNILSHNLEQLKETLGGAHSGVVKLLGVLYATKSLPSVLQPEERKGQVSFVKAILWELYTSDDAIGEFIDANMEEFNGTPGEPASYGLLDTLHSEQLFKLSYWKVATEELNYRRFFTVNDLISVRVEDKAVFDDTHQLILRLVEEGAFDGLRVDHIDGLYDPLGYLERLREKAPETYITVEKILAYGESLPRDWPVQGTTGYDYLNFINGLFCNRKSEKRFTRIYTGFTGMKIPYEQLVTGKKRLIIGKHMAGDIDNLALLIKKVIGIDRRGTDITLYSLRRALVELLALFPVYRTYINANRTSLEDRTYLQDAITRAKQINPALTRELLFIERFFLLQLEEYAPEEEKGEWTNVIMRFQQFTGPLMAKGFEDTTLYIYNRLISLNDVGGWPEVFGITTEEFHQYNVKRMQDWSHSMNATSTHDAKRGEDVRARINVLSEIPDEWGNVIKKWSKINRKYKIRVNGEQVPDTNDEYFLYQTLIGSFPFHDDDYEVFVKRIQEYMLKSIREAKVHTAWIKPDSEYESGVHSFIEAILDRSPANEFFADFYAFQSKIAHYGILNSLSQCLLKVTSPGVPDFYQGTEMWDLSLVDPDNRRPVDYTLRSKLLREITNVKNEQYPTFIKNLLASRDDGRVKLFLIYRLLLARMVHPELFDNGSYLQLNTHGHYQEHVIAFARKDDDMYAVAVAPRFCATICAENELPLGKNIWADTSIELPTEEKRVWRNAITSEEFALSHARLPVGEILQQFPVALLISKHSE